MKWWGGRVSNIVGHGCSGSREELVIVLPPPLHLFSSHTGVQDANIFESKPVRDGDPGGSAALLWIETNHKNT